MSLEELTREELLVFKERVSLLQLIDSREECEESLAEFIKGAWSSIDSSDYSENWAVQGLTEHLEAVTLGHIKRLLVNMPPRTQKTTSLSVCWPAWTWARKRRGFLDGPQVKFMCGSYNDVLSLDNATKTRRLITSPWYQARWGDRYGIQYDQSSKAHFANTEGGARLAVSVGGTLLGLGADAVVVDDPYNLEAAESEKDRLRAANWWAEIHSTRLNNPKESAVVVGMQRLHANDISGIILDSDEDWVVYCIPMRHDERRHCVTVVLPQFTGDEPWQDPRVEEGELMWPERFGETEVAKLEAALGPYYAAGRLQQMPSPKGGGIIKRDWWQLWDHNTAQQYGLEWRGERKEFPPFELVCASLDTSYGEKQENDFNAMTVWGIWLDKVKNQRIMLMFAWAKRLPLHGKVISAKPGEGKLQFETRQKVSWGLVEWVADTCRRYRVRRLFIENKTRGRDVANEINRLYAREKWGVELVNPVKDKVSRAHSVVPMFTDDMIWAPETKWSEEVIVNCAEFPKGPHDDLLDSTVQFLKYAREHELVVRADEASAALEESQLYQGKRDSVADAYGV